MTPEQLLADDKAGKHYILDGDSKRVLAELAKALHECSAALIEMADELHDVGISVELAVGIERPKDPPTKKEVQDALMVLYMAGKHDTVTEILHRHGAPRFEKLDPSQYSVVMEEIEEEMKK